MFEELKDKILAWAERKSLIPGNPDKQALKLMEEAGELAGALLKNNQDKIIDGIGDCLVVLIILAEQLDLQPEACLFKAWNEIKDRTGKTVNGSFIKDLR
jgi:NTP pyrophosphatase (non-canonical NTP hydrolase)